MICDPSELLRDLKASMDLAAAIPCTGNIASRLSLVFGNETFAQRLRPLRLDASDPLRTIASLVVEVFSRYHHFTLLHGVTSCHALRRLLPYVENLQTAVSQYWYAICAAYLCVTSAIEEDPCCH